VATATSSGVTSNHAYRFTIASIRIGLHMDDGSSSAKAVAREPRTANHAAWQFLARSSHANVCGFCEPESGPSKKRQQ
jgi:hypothetical protein